MFTLPLLLYLPSSVSLSIHPCLSFTSASAGCLWACCVISGTVVLGGYGLTTWRQSAPPFTFLLYNCASEDVVPVLLNFILLFIISLLIFKGTLTLRIQHTEQLSRCVHLIYMFCSVTCRGVVVKPGFHFPAIVGGIAVEQQVWTLEKCIAQHIGAIITPPTLPGKLSLAKLLRHHRRHSAARL